MRHSLSVIALVVIPTLLTACGAPLEPDDLSSSESESELSQSQRALRASDGPFAASITTYTDTHGQQQQRLQLRYTEALGSSFLGCHQFPHQKDLTAIFVTGSASTSHPMVVNCPRSYGDNGGVLNDAVLIVERQTSPEFWETLFPRHADGSRWYAMRVAALNANGAWDSRFGADYRLIFQ